MAMSQLPSTSSPSTTRDVGDIVTARILGEKRSGEIVGDEGLSARYGPGPEYIWVVDVVGAGTYRVPESDILEPA